MKGYWENLRPFEKRVVVGVGALFFIVLNFLFVFPHFSDLNAMHYRMEEAQRNLAKYQTEIAQTNVYVTELRKMEGDASDVPSEEQDFQFANAINTQVLRSGVHQRQGGATKTQTNQFFLEKTQSINVSATEQALVDFLYQLGAGNSQIRVRDLTLRPDPSRQQLEAGVKLIASYQKKSTPRPVLAGGSKTNSPSTAVPQRVQSPAPRTNVPAAKPQSTTTKQS